MPTTISAHARGAPSGLLVVLLFLLLTGVLGMHGWGSHGVAGAGHTPVAHDSGLAGLQHPAVAIARVVGEAASSAPPLLNGSTDRQGMVLAGLCVAVLSTVGLVLLLLRAVRRRAAVPLPSPRLSHARRVNQRDRDPPSLARLSVLRR
jgi:hypothetical protein